MTKTEAAQFKITTENYKWCGITATPSVKWDGTRMRYLILLNSTATPFVR